MLFWYGEDKKVRKVELEKELHLLAESHVTRSVDNTARVLISQEIERVRVKPMVDVGDVQVCTPLVFFL
jgi:hypothetical protein